VSILAVLLLCGCAAKRRRLPVNPDHGELLEDQAGAIAGEYYERKLERTVYLAFDANGTCEAI